MSGASNPTARATTGADQGYWQALAEDRLDLPRCTGCGRWHWPAVWRCGECGSWEHAWVPVPLTGEIFTWTRTWHPFGGLEGIGVPFVTAVIALDDAPPLRMVGIFEDDDEEIAIGLRVQGRVGETAFGGQSVPALRWRRETMA